MSDKKTTEQIEALKRQWLHDPIWDIEETEGYEAHKAELLAFRKEKEAEWDIAEKNRKDSDEKTREEMIVKFAASMGIDNIKVASMLYRLREKQADQEDKIKTCKHLFNELNASLGESLKNNDSWNGMIELLKDI